MTFGTFLLTNRRWLIGGVSLTFFSSFGQTFFIALFAGEIRQEYGLSHGGFGALYMLATLASAASLVIIGRVVDDHALRTVSAAVIVMLALAASFMALSSHVVLLVLTLYLLRLFGQGMMTHVAMTAMGRWFVAERGRAVSVTATGHQLGEGILPVLVVALLSRMDWRSLWLASAVLLLVVALPILWRVFGAEREATMRHGLPAEQGRQWNRREVLGDTPFWLVCTGVLAPAFIGTSVFFHQVHLGQIKAWEPSIIASSFIVLSLTTVCAGLVTGQVIDRFSARQLLPVFLIPLGLGCVLLSLGAPPVTMMGFMVLLGLSYGMSGAVFGAVWPELYGTRHLGAVRSLVAAAMVFSSALGPGVTGWLIDRGVGFEHQLLYMAGYCVLAALVLLPVSRTLGRRLLIQNPRAPDTDTRSR